MVVNPFNVEAYHIFYVHKLISAWCKCPEVTSFILAVRHEGLLHGLREEDLVLLLGGGGRSGGDHGVCHHPEVLHHGDVAQLLGDGERGLPIVGDSVGRSIGVQKQIHNL